MRIDHYSLANSLNGIDCHQSTICKMCNIKKTTIDYNTIHLEGTVELKPNYAFRILESLHKPVKLVIDIGVIHKERRALSREGVYLKK